MQTVFISRRREIQWDSLTLSNPWQRTAMTNSGNNDTTKVAGGMMEALEQHPGGLGAILQNFRNNGLSDHVDAMQNGQTPSVTPDAGADRPAGHWPARHHRLQGRRLTADRTSRDGHSVADGHGSLRAERKRSKLKRPERNAVEARRWTEAAA